MKSQKYLLLSITLLLLAGLACQLGANAPSADDVAAAATTAASAATTAASAAATFAASDQATVIAQAVATNIASAGDAAATIAAGGFDASDLQALKEKFAAVTPDENGNITITVTQDEMNQAIAAKQAQSPDNALQGAQVAFTSGNIVLTGIVSDSGAALAVVFRPSVVNGVLQFEVLSATIGNINVPPVLLTAAEATLNATLSEAIGGLPPTFTLQSVVIGEGAMTLTASR
ncbi:MAG: hypothetical protein ACE5FD_07315 [Anaerolineae bacterium]